MEWGAGWGVGAGAGVGGGGGGSCRNGSVSRVSEYPSLHVVTANRRVCILQIGRHHERMMLRNDTRCKNEHFATSE